MLGEEEAPQEGGGLVLDVLYEAPDNTFQTVGDTINLSADYTDYDLLLIEKWGTGYGSYVISPEFITANKTIYFTHNAGNKAVALRFTVTNNATLTIAQFDNNDASTCIAKITGIKAATGGSSGGSGTGVEREVLWSGMNTTNNSTITLSHDYTDYDMIIGYVSPSSSNGDDVLGSTIINPSVHYTMQITGNAASSNLEFDIGLVFSGNSATVWHNLNPSAGFALSRIEGIKFNGSGSSNTTTSKVLWQGTNADLVKNNTLTLSDDYSNYDEVIFVHSGTATCYTIIINSLDFSYNSDSSQYKCLVGLSFNSNTATVDYVTLGTSLVSTGPCYILGKKYGGGAK